MKKNIHVKINRELDIHRHHEYKELGNLFELLNLESYTRLIYDWGVHQGQDWNKYIIRDYDGWVIRGMSHRNELLEMKSDNIQPVKDRLRELTEENIILKKALKEIQREYGLNVKINMK